MPCDGELWYRGYNVKTLIKSIGPNEFGFEKAAEEIKRMENLEKARKEMYGEEKEKPMKQNMFKVV